MFISKIAFRNIFRQKRRSILTGLTMAGGFILLSIAYSVSEGTYDNVIDIFTRSYTGHVQIHKKGYLDRPSIYKNFTDLNSLTEILDSNDKVESWSPRVFSSALSFIEKKTTVANIIGIDPKREALNTNIKNKIKNGRLIAQEPSNEVMIGPGLSEVLEAELGDQLVLISQGADGSIANDIFIVTAIFKGDISSFDRNNCYIHIKKAQEFLMLPDRYHEINIVLTDFHDSRSVAAWLDETIEKELEAKPWQVINKQFYETMLADKQGMWIALIIIVVIVAIGVLNTVLMAILERTREFGVLKALGTRPASILYMIILESVYLALLSVLFGLIVSLVINYLMMKYGIDYPTAVDISGFVVSTMYGSLKLKVFVLPAVVTFFTALIVSVFPAIRAMRIKPVNAMRTH